MAQLRRFVDPRTNELIDRGLALWFPGPASFTGEDMAELHVHGGRRVVAATIEALIEGCGCEMAEAGAFARRAFDNGKLDLAAVEGLADLIDADTEAQRRQALRQAEGELGRAVERWSRELLEAVAWAEAGLDFSDEGDVATLSLAKALEPAERVRKEIEEALAASVGGERLREGYVVAIAGPPNAGKSTLLNALAKRDVAIVSEIPGTTRDAIEVRLELGGLPVTLIDMAGIRDSGDPIEQEGICRAQRLMRSADLTLWLQPVDGSCVERATSPEGAVVIGTKSDLSDDCDLAPKHGKGFVNLSALTGEGINSLLDEILKRAQQSMGDGSALVSRERQRQALRESLQRLEGARQSFEGCDGEELVAEDLRLALRALGRITGRVDVEDVLGVIFGRFCIGK